MAQSVNAASPLPLVANALSVALGQVSIAPVVPVDGVMVNATFVVLTGLPPASVTSTVGCVAKAIPPVELPPGCWLKLTIAGGPTATLKLELSKGRRLPAVARSWYAVPALSMAQSVKIAVPVELVARVFDVVLGQ